MPQRGGREGVALQYGGQTTYLCQGDPVGEHPIFLKFLIRQASYFDKVLQYTQTYTMALSWWKEVKALRICETPKILRAYVGLYPNEPRIDRQKKNHLADEEDKIYSCCLENGGNRVSRWTRKSMRANRPTTEVRQLRLRSICDDCLHKIFTHVTIRFNNTKRPNDPNTRAE